MSRYDSMSPSLGLSLAPLLLDLPLRPPFPPRPTQGGLLSVLFEDASYAAILLLFSMAI